jgi:hypothetical protein
MGWSTSVTPTTTTNNNPTGRFSHEPLLEHSETPGVLGRDAEVPTSETTNDESYVVLALLLKSATSDKPTGLWIVRTQQIPVVCSGPDFCGANRDMKEGDHIEVDGELRLCEEDGPVVCTREPRVMRVTGIKVRASLVRKTDLSAISAELSTGG